MNLFGGTIQNLEKTLNLSTLKNRAIANNIANVDTPYYKAKEVVSNKTFDNMLQESIKANRTHEKHFSFSNEENKSDDGSIKEREGTIYNHNGNNVDIDKEMSELAQNQIYYQALVDQLNRKFQNIQTVIRGGG